MNPGDDEHSELPEGEPFELLPLAGDAHPAEPDELSASHLEGDFGAGLESQPEQELAVDDLLSEALAPAAEADLFSSPDLPKAPTFQLFFHSAGNLDSNGRATIKKALETLGVADTKWASAVPVISQLTEYQLISLLQTARALGLQATAKLQPEQQMPSEEDLALGDLSIIPESEFPVLESAPSVTLPKGEKDVLLCTADQLTGGKVLETFGIIIAHRSIARRIFREEEMRKKLEKELHSVPGRSETTLPSSHLHLLLRDLLQDLRKNALAKGGNTVLGVKLEAFPESSTLDPQLEQLRLVAFGTAAVVEKAEQ